MSPRPASSRCDGFDVAGALTNTKPESVRPVQISPESTLTALSQLGALKLGCQRSFVSIIDHNSQFVLAEATKSVSLCEQDIHKEGDALYLDPGTSLQISTPNITANRSRYIVRDFLQEPHLKDRSYVVEWPFMRFYASVPIRSPTGYVIGGYCVIDDKPRHAFSDEEVQTLQEISDCVANHLELMRMRQDFERAERLLKGLNSFVEGHSSIRLPPTSGPSAIPLPGRRAATEVLSVEPPKAGDAKPNGAPPSALDNVREHSTDPMEISIGANRKAIEKSSQPQHTPSNSEDAENPRKVNAGAVPDASKLLGWCDSNSANIAARSATEGLLAPSNIKRTFSRASNLIRESMDLCGVVFFDAYLSEFATRAKLRRSRPDLLQDVSDPGDVSSGDDELGRNLVSNCVVLPNDTSAESAPPEPNEIDQSKVIKECKMLGQSVNSSSPSGDEPRAVPKFLLKRLLRKHPHGETFSSEHSTFIDGTEGKSRRLSRVWQSCAPRNSNSRSRKILERKADSQLLFEMLPGARSIIFYPLWDSRKARWFAGCIGWTTDPKRALQSEEVTYLAAFGNSVMVEINRIEAVANDMAKSDFISNISHELRSPLHSILASAELLQDSSTGPEQDGMIEMAHVCGRTLLDTMNHLLDHAKISNLSNSRASLDSGPESGSMHEPLGLVSNFDLSELIEEVVEFVYTGYQYQKRLSTSFKEGLSTESAPAVGLDLNGSQVSGQHIISIILDVAARPNWIVTSETGAWRRIVMNLFGNSLKYTQSGFIKVALWADERPSPNAGSKSTMMHLSVTDTGKGISEDYLRNRLYTPFAQEDTLGVGVGLGLSIVQQIVTGLRGTVNIQSKVGSGTNQSMAKLFPKFEGLTVCLLVEAWPDSRDTSTAAYSLSGKSPGPLYSCISQILANQFGIKVFRGDSHQNVSADLFMIAEECFDFWNNLAHPPAEMLARLRAAPLIVLCQSLLPKNRHFGTYISQPFGPVKLAKALDRSLQLRTNAMDIGRELTTQRLLPESLDCDSSTDNNNGQRPLTEADSLQLKSIPAPVFSKSTATHPDWPRILLVDDNDINLKIMMTYMQKLQCSFEVATNGLQAYDKYRDTAEKGHCFDFVLMDVSMPVTNTLCASRKIRAFEREQGHSPTTIIALTGLVSTKAEEEAFASGVDIFLTKPVQLKKLKEILHFQDDQHQASRLNGGPNKKRKAAGAY